MPRPLIKQKCSFCKTQHIIRGDESQSICVICREDKIVLQNYIRRKQQFLIRIPNLSEELFRPVHYISFNVCNTYVGIVIAYKLMGVFFIGTIVEVRLNYIKVKPAARLLDNPLSVGHIIKFHDILCKLIQ